MELPQKIQNIVSNLSRFPGVGEKTALRQSLVLTKWSPLELTEFSRAITELASLGRCVKCGLFCDEEICHICANPRRLENKTLCVVENITDCLAIEKSEQYQGHFHILGGVLNPLLGVGPDELELENLFSRVKNKGYQNIILAINPSVEGDATCSYIKQQLSDEVDVDRIGFGIPMGGSLEYVDALTITKALENRKKM